MSSKKNIDDLRIKLNDLLLNFVRLVVKQQLIITDENYSIGYGPDWRDSSELDKRIIKEFGIRVYFVDKQRSENPISVLFVLTDKLGEIFKKYDFAPFLNVTLEDNQDDFFEFASVDEIVAIKHCSPLFTNSKNEAIYAEFVEAVDKQLLLTTIKYA